MKQSIKTIITITVTAAVTFSVTAISLRVAPRLSTDSKTKEISTKLDAIATYLDSNYLYDDIDYEKLNDAAAKAYVDALDEPYTHYYNAEEFKEYMSQVEEGYVGIGIVISADTDKDKILVVSPIADSPAYKAGIKPGDYIISVDGTEYGADEMNECVDSITAGKVGTTVDINVERNGELLNFKIKRDDITEESASSKMLGDGIGYIRLTNFNIARDGYEDSSYTEFVDCVEALQKDGMEKLIIDLRDNPGGVLSVVCQIADYILPEGIITYTETRKGERTEYRSDKKDLDIPIVVLINGNSASASEILTGALMDYDKAEVVGTKSFGKGIVQTTFPFRDGSGMSMTISKYYTPKGNSIHGVGIEPDYVVEVADEYKNIYASNIPEGEDDQLKKAVEILKEK